jgi:hypothetical protein
MQLRDFAGRWPLSFEGLALVLEGCYSLREHNQGPRSAHRNFYQVRHGNSRHSRTVLAAAAT